MKRTIFIIALLMIFMNGYSTTRFGEVESGQITNSCGQKWNYTMHYASGWSEAERMYARYSRYQQLQAAVDGACGTGKTTVHFLPVIEEPQPEVPTSDSELSDPNGPVVQPITPVEAD